MMRLTARAIAGCLLASLLLAPSADAQPRPPAPNVVVTQVNLGVRQAGLTYPLALTAQNINCEDPMDFRFMSNADWLRLPADPVARGVAAGQSRDLQVTIDLTNLAPAHYEAIVEVECDNCGWLIFKTCRVDKQQIHFGMDVAPPPGGAQPAQPKIDLNDRRIPESLRNKVKAEQEAWELALKKKKPCDEELEKLRATAAAAQEAADKARQAADTAVQDARNAQAQADQARKDIEDAVKAVNDAGKAVDDAEKERAGADTTAGRNEANEKLAKAKAALEAAQKRLRAARSAAEHLNQKAADAAAKAAKEKRDAANKAAAAASAAQAAASAKQQECDKLQQEAAKAQAAKDKAEQEARDAVKPPAPQAGPTPEQIEAQRRKVQECNEAMGRKIEDQRRALEALAEIGALRDQDTPKGYESDLDAWGKAVDKAEAGLGKVPPIVGGPVAAVLKTGLNFVAAITKIAIGGAKVGLMHHAPNSPSHDPDATKKWLRESGHATDKVEAERVYKEMQRYTDAGRSTAVMRTDLERMSKECEGEQKKLEAMQAAAKK